MDDNNKYDVQDLVVTALEQKPEEFSQAFNDILVGKLQAAVEARKYEISQEMFAGPNDQEDEFDDETDEEELDADAEQEEDLTPEE